MNVDLETILKVSGLLTQALTGQDFTKVVGAALELKTLFESFSEVGGETNAALEELQAAIIVQEKRVVAELERIASG